MESKCSFPCLQEPVTVIHSIPQESVHIIEPFSWNFILILSSLPYASRTVKSLPVLGFLTKIFCMNISCLLSQPDYHLAYTNIFLFQYKLDTHYFYYCDCLGNFLSSPNLLARWLYNKYIISQYTLVFVTNFCHSKGLTVKWNQNKYCNASWKSRSNFSLDITGTQPDKT